MVLRRGWRDDADLPRLIALGLFLAIVCVAGGASRADALGQTMVRGAAFLFAAGAVVHIGWTGRPVDRALFAPALIVAAAAAIVSLQLIPLPPALWQSLSGRAPFVEAAALAGFPQPWRPLAIVPDGAVNALFSLSVPATILLLLALLPAGRLKALKQLLVAIGLFSAVLGLIQLIGADPRNPFINEDAGVASGLLANRNHQALLLAIGILLVPDVVVGSPRGSIVRLALAIGATIFLTMMTIVTGSRAGLLLLLIALPLSIALPLRRWGGLPERARGRWLAAGGALVVALLAVFWLAVAADRGASIDRLIALDPTGDLRRRALPTVLDLVGRYLPVGSGFGSFDPLFRMAEPDALLKLTYFNHAHNDFLEIAMEGGVLGIALLVAALVWAVRRALIAFRAGVAGATGLYGAAIVLLVLVASVFDYPARTPIIMTALAIAAAWLAIAPAADERQLYRR